MNSYPFTFVPLTMQHAAELQAIHWESLHTNWNTEEIKQTLKSSDAFGFVAKSVSKIQGFILCRVAAEEAELLTMAIDAAFRRQGTGRALLAAAEKEAARRGAVAMFLEVAADNAPAHRLYEKTGFFQVGQRRGYYGRGTTDALVLRRDL